MSGTPPARPASVAATAVAATAVASVRDRGRRPFQLVWLIPVLALGIAGWLAYQAIAARGTAIHLTFTGGDGIVAGQTKVKHKAVELGTVRNVRLSDDLSHIEVAVDMTRQAERTLTDEARFWVVRPRLTIANVSGLDTLVSGSYIEMDPGPAGGARRTEFTGLDEPPAVRSDTPGTTFDLSTDRIGSISSGSPVFFRDIAVGEVLGYDLGPRGDRVRVHAFIRRPFDGYVSRATHFWNASGIAVNLGAQGVRVQVESIQAVIGGGIAFDTARDVPEPAPLDPHPVFPLFASQTAADDAGYSQRIRLITYIEGSVRGLAAGAAVELYGIQIGTVTGVKLELADDGASSRVVVHMEVQPERFQHLNGHRVGDALPVARTLVRRGLRAQLRTANFLTGQMVMSFDFQAGANTADATQAGDEIIIPSVAGGLDSITSSLTAVAAKLESLPLDQIGRELTDTLRGVSNLVNGPEVRQTLTALSQASRELPAIGRSLAGVADRSGRLVGSVDAGYGEGSPFRRDIARLLSQVSDTARSVRLLADYLNEHPEALIRGRTDRSRP